MISDINRMGELLCHVELLSECKLLIPQEKILLYFFTEQQLVRNHSNVVGMEIKTEIEDWTDCYKCQKIHFFTEQQLVRNHSNVVGMEIKTEIGDWTDCFRCQKIHLFTEQQLVRNHSNVVGMKSDVIGCSVTVTIIFLEFPFFVKQQHLKIMNIFTLKMITMFMYSIFNFTIHCYFHCCVENYVLY